MSSVDQRIDKIILSIEKMQQDRVKERKEREKRQQQWEQEREKREKEQEKRQQHWEKEQEKRQQQWEQEREKRQQQWEHQHAIKMAEYIKQIEGKYGYETGSFTEKIYFANLAALYKKRDWALDKVYMNYPIVDDNLDQKTEVDVISVNPEFIIATEVKLTLSRQKVDAYVSKLPMIKQHLVQLGCHQPLFGGVACIKDYLATQDNKSQLMPHSDVSALEYAEQEHGLYTFEIFAHTAEFSGGTGKDDFKPKIYTI